MKRAYVYKLRPTREQATVLTEALETGRRLYNHALAERKAAWEMERRSLGFAAQSATLPKLKPEWPQLKALHSQVAQDVLHRVDRALQAFFRRGKAGQTPGYPRFRGQGWYDSLTYPQWGNGAAFKAGRLALSKLGSFRVHVDRPLAGTPKTCTIRRRADGWYACIVCEVGEQPLPPTGESVGLDLGLEALATLSTGERIENPRWYRSAQRRLQTAQRRVARRQKGSKRRRQAVELLAKAHLKVARQRLDFHHKTANAIVERFEHIAVEQLNIRGMARNHPLAKSIHDAGWGLFLSVLRGKAASAGRPVVDVAPAGTSQVCAACGAVVPKRLKERWHACRFCGVVRHRDHNAALNLRKQGGGTAFGELPAGAGG